MKVLSHEQTTNTTETVFISFIDMEEEERAADSNTCASKKKPTGHTQSLSFVLPLTFFIHVQQITPTFLKVSLTMSL
jgi:hypothetical protein